MPRCASPLHCGISTGPMTAMDRSLPRRSKPDDRACPLCPESDRFGHHHAIRREVPTADKRLADRDRKPGKRGRCKTDCGLTGLPCALSRPYERPGYAALTIGGSSGLNARTWSKRSVRTVFKKASHARVSTSQHAAAMFRVSISRHAPISRRTTRRGASPAIDRQGSVFAGLRASPDVERAIDHLMPRSLSVDVRPR
jgi:hypothetical protein